jgi:hypothetical protein
VSKGKPKSADPARTITGKPLINLKTGGDEAQNTGKPSANLTEADAKCRAPSSHRWIHRPMITGM